MALQNVKKHPVIFEEQHGKVQSMHTTTTITFTAEGSATFPPSTSLTSISSIASGGSSSGPDPKSDASMASVATRDFEDEIKHILDAHYARATS